MKVQVYRNLHKNCWSVRHKGKIVAHLDELYLKHCTFHVQPAGHAKVLREKRKNVHAYIKGEIDDGLLYVEYGKMKRVSYNPYKAPFFRHASNGRRIDKAQTVKLGADGKVYY